MKFWISLVVATAISSACQARDVVYFLSNKYTSDASPQKRCDPEKDEGDYLILDRDGIRNFALKCDFTTFHIRPGNFETYVAVASCGDDTGITRGDLITLIPEADGQIRVQSQNEFIATEISGGKYKSVISGVYAWCS